MRLAGPVYFLDQLLVNFGVCDYFRQTGIHVTLMVCFPRLSCPFQGSTSHRHLGFSSFLFVVVVVVVVVV